MRETHLYKGYRTVARQEIDEALLPVGSRLDMVEQRHKNNRTSIELLLRCLCHLRRDGFRLHWLVHNQGSVPEAVVMSAYVTEIVQGAKPRNQNGF